MKYFSRITADHWTAKNKLEAAAHLLAYEMDRKLIPDSDVKEFLELFQHEMNKLCQSFPRCKPLHFSWHVGYSFTEHDGRNKKWNELWIYYDGVFNMSLFEVKET